MLRLQSACADIPALTTATKELHKSVTRLVMDAHSVQQQQEQPGGGVAGASAPFMMQQEGRRGSASMMVSQGRTPSHRWGQVMMGQRHPPANILTERYPRSPRCNSA